MGISTPANGRAMNEQSFFTTKLFAAFLAGERQAASEVISKKKG